MRPPARATSNMRHRVLVIDDDAYVRKYVAKALAQAQLAVATAGSGRSGIRMLTEQSYDAVVCDLRMPDVDGLKVLDYTRELPQSPVFILLTGFGSVATAVEAVHRGAHDFLEKPLEDLGVLAERIHALLREAEQTPEAGWADNALIGDSEPMARLREKLRQFAQSEATLLIDGETGTGKSRAARALWEASPRSSGPFGVVNCASTSDQLLQSELFGHVRGAFDGALQARAGRLEEVAGGVLVLDEVGELRPGMQHKLLNVLKEGRYQPVGSGRSRPTDVRFVAVTNRHLWRDVRSGHFRSDLFFRVNVLRLTMPPLRRRREDIPLLVERFCERWATQKGLPSKRFTEAALRRLSELDWPGNVRQLETLVQRVLTSGDSDLIDWEVLQAELDEGTLESRSSEKSRYPSLQRAMGAADSLPEALECYQRELLRHALDESDGDLEEAAGRLKIGRDELDERLSELGMAD